MMPLEEEPPLPACDTYVYFLLDHELGQVKIGWTLDVACRTRALSRQRGRKLDLLGSIEGDYNLERLLHARFANYRAPGTREWYSTEILPELQHLLK
jgi:hypothetical protein